MHLSAFFLPLPSHRNCFFCFFFFSSFLHATTLSKHPLPLSTTVNRICSLFLQQPPPETSTIQTHTYDMADQNTAAAPEDMSLDKGKGKAVEDTPVGQDVSMDEDETSEDESGPEDVCHTPLYYLPRVA